jgi:hypothetical protein
MAEEIEVLELVARRLDETGIAYMVTGSMAVAFYAIPRMTRDVDLVVELSAGEADRVSALLAASEFYVDPDAVRDAVARQATFNAIHQRMIVKVDFVVRKDTDYRRTEFARRRRLLLEGHPIFVVAPEDLIISKLDWARDSRSEVQLGDARDLLRAVPGLDHAYLDEWIARLGLTSLYREVTK